MEVRALCALIFAVVHPPKPHVVQLQEWGRHGGSVTVPGYIQDALK